MKYIDIKAAAYAIQASGLIAFLSSLVMAETYQSMSIMIYGAIAFAILYALGGALLILIDISISVRASAVAAIEQNERRKVDTSVKTRPDINDRLLEKQRSKRTAKQSGLQHLDPAKRREA